MEAKAKLIRKRSRSDASGQRATAQKVTGVVWYPGGPVDQRTYDCMDVSWGPFHDKARRKKYQAASMENIQKIKNQKEYEEEEEKMRQSLKKEMETLHGVGLGTDESEHTLKVLTYEQIKESEADYPVRLQWETDCETPEEVRKFQDGVFRKKSQSLETRLPRINTDGFPAKNWADLQNICKSLTQLGL